MLAFSWVKVTPKIPHCHRADRLVDELPALVPELVSLVRAGGSDEVKGHALSTLVAMVTHHQEAVLECGKEEVGLKSALTDLAEIWSAEEHEVRKIVELWGERKLLLSDLEMYIVMYYCQVVG